MWSHFSQEIKISTADQKVSSLSGETQPTYRPTWPQVKIAFSCLQHAGERNFFISYSCNRWEVINPSPVHVTHVPFLPLPVPRLRVIWGQHCPIVAAGPYWPNCPITQLSPYLARKPGTFGRNACSHWPKPHVHICKYHYTKVQGWGCVVAGTVDVPPIFSPLLHGWAKVRFPGFVNMKWKKIVPSCLL